MNFRKTPREKLASRTVFERIELGLKVGTFALTFLSMAFIGSWTLYKYVLSGSSGWVINSRIEAKVLPYRGDLRLLVVNVKSVNPRESELLLDPSLGDSYELRVRELSLDAKAKASVDENGGELIQRVNLIPSGEQYDFMPRLEMDDMRVFVLRVNTTVMLSAEVNVHSGDRDRAGKPETDYVRASTVVRVAP